MKILHIMPSVDPRGGGPIEGVFQRGLRLQQMGHGIGIVTLDDPAAGHLAACPLPLVALGPSRGSYRYNPRLLPWLLAHAPAWDAFVVHGLWQYHAFAAWRALTRLQRPYHVFPHGMLDPWFRRQYPLKHLKKWLYWPWADYRVLRDAAGVLFTSDEERLQARRSFWLYRARERVVGYGTGQPPQDAQRLREQFLAAYPALRGRRIVLYLSRIHEKKGCDLLVQAFAEQAAADPSLHLLMAGPDPGGLLPRLQALAAAAGGAGRISWPGMLQGELKWGAFHASEVFALPSHQENFGIAVAEALGCGLPVLVSDQVNIWREIQADGAGLVAPDTLDGTRALLRQWLVLAPAERAAYRPRAAAAYARRYSVEAMASSLLEVLGADAPAPVAAAPRPGAAR